MYVLKSQIGYYSRIHGRHTFNASRAQAYRFATRVDAELFATEQAAKRESYGLTFTVESAQ